MIRTATIDDLDALVQIEGECFGSDAWTRNSWEQEFSGNRQIHLAQSDDQPIGFVIVTRSGDDAELLRIGVVPAHRRGGAARELMAHALSQAARTGATSLFLEVETTNTGALALYEEAGFTRLSQRANYYGNGRHAQILTRPLREVSA